MTPPVSSPLPSWRDLVWPKEHGSWSLALEPVALGLLAAPSLGGGALALSVVAAFFSRRPLRSAFVDTRPERRRVAGQTAAGCGALALAALLAGCGIAGVRWLPWLLPSALGGAVFLVFDLRQSGREQEAEVAGAAAFAWLPAGFAILAGWSPAEAAALGAVMLARAVPTVLCVRSVLRARKTGTAHRVGPAVAASMALVGVVALVFAQLAPAVAAIAVAVLGARTFVLLVYPRPALRASTMGMIEAALGVAFVVTVALTWAR